MFPTKTASERTYARALQQRPPQPVLAHQDVFPRRKSWGWWDGEQRSICERKALLTEYGLTINLLKKEIRILMYYAHMHRYTYVYINIYVIHKYLDR